MRPIRNDGGRMIDTCYRCERQAIFDDEQMARDTALVFESLAEAQRAKELIDAAGQPKYWLTFIDRVEHHDVGPVQGAGQVGGQPRSKA
jgi:hypothetical protein